jgi:hypothetical protein
MNKYTFATITGGALTAVALGFPLSALAAPSGVGSAQDTVNTLESSGYKVILNKVGRVLSSSARWVRSAQARRVVRPVHNGANPVNQIVYQTVYLTANC